MPLTREQAGAKVREAGLSEEEEENLLAFINQLPEHGLSTLDPGDNAAKVVRVLSKQRGKYSYKHQASSTRGRQADIGGCTCTMAHVRAREP
jgi:hypothetical protein